VEKAAALYEFVADHKDELSFHVGDVITVLEKTSEGWWKGKLRGEIGMFPIHFVQLLRPRGCVPVSSDLVNIYIVVYFNVHYVEALSRAV